MSRWSVLGAVLTAGVVGGALSALVFGARPSWADGGRPTTSAIHVPAEGLVFRGQDGKAIARLTSDASGGVLELYNRDEQPAARMKTSGFSGSMDLGGCPTVVAPASTVKPALNARRDLGF